jgi:uncharacterized membrane protein
VPIGDAYSWGWKKFTENAGAWIVIALVVVAIYLISALIRLPFADSIIVVLLLSGIGALAGFAAQYGLVRASLLTANGEKPTVGRAWDLKDFGPFLIAAILEGVIVTIGFILCFLPGLAALVLLWFTPFFVIDKGLPPIDALKASVDLVTKNLGGIILFLIVSVAIYALGAALCGIGLLVAGPVVLLATAFVYRRLAGTPVAA